MGSVAERRGRRNVGAIAAKKGSDRRWSPRPAGVHVERRTCLLTSRSPLSTLTTMSDPVVCLECGGLIEGDADPIEFPAGQCSCPRPSVEVGCITCPSCGGALTVGARACPYCSSTLATTRCAACTAWNLAQARHCHACGKSLDTASQGASVRTQLACPRCEARLQARDYASLQVSECDSCGGMFIEPSMMDRIVASHDTSTGLHLALPVRKAARETTVRYVRCPVCTTMMNRQMFGRISGVVVDVCRSHGVWFDAGELSEVIAFVEAGGLERARVRQAEELAEQRRAETLERARASSEVAPSSLALGAAPLGSVDGIQMAAEFLDALRTLWRGGMG